MPDTGPDIGGDAVASCDVPLIEQVCASVCVCERMKKRLSESKLDRNRGGGGSISGANSIL